MRLHPDEIDRAVEGLLLADGDLKGDDAPPELLLERRDRPVEGGALAVHPVDDEEDRPAELAANFQTRSVWTSTPETASRTMRAASAAWTAARASGEKMP